MELNAQSIEAIVRKVISGMDAPADEQTDAVPLGVSNRHIHLTREDMEPCLARATS